jgi:hypothetical protein
MVCQMPASFVGLFARRYFPDGNGQSDEVQMLWRSSLNSRGQQMPRHGNLAQDSLTVKGVKE